MATVGEAWPHVVIVGGGFGGLYAARALRKARVRLTLLDRRNHHLFQPLLYQVATAALNPSDIAVPIRSILRRQKNATVLLAEARSVDLKEKKVILTDGEIAFDALILATGASHSYFGHEDWAAAAPGLKSIEDALQIRRRVLLAFEHAEREKNPQAVRDWLTFVIIGAGPTGVELAGAIAENARHALARDFRAIDPTEARVILLEGAPRVLPPFPPGLSAKAQEALLHLGVEVRTGALVTGVDAEGVFVGAERIPARTVLWAAGVAASPLARGLGAPLDRAGRVVVTPELTLPGRSDVFVIGDLALVQQDGGPVPGVATAAIQEGRHAAGNAVRALGGVPLLPFRYRDKGSLATIGRGKAVAAFPGLERSGFFAWCVWLLVHIFFLIGFRNRVMVLLGWAWAYVTWQRGARLITGEDVASAPEKPRA
jgi:NADH dehydrogenase